MFPSSRQLQAVDEPYQRRNRKMIELLPDTIGGPYDADLVMHTCTIIMGRASHASRSGTF